MKERPIIFSSEMVRALLDGRKTMTRREFKLTKNFSADALKHTTRIVHANGLWFPMNELDLHFKGILCPYGEIGDRLWVRETWVRPHAFIHPETMTPMCYRATNLYPETLRWRPSIHMPRKYSRITLEITNIRVERLGDITEEDCLKEGIKFDGEFYNGAPHEIKGTPKAFYFARQAFQTIWESIKGPGSWDLNPWVWVIEFRRV